MNTEQFYTPSPLVHMCDVFDRPSIRGNLPKIFGILGKAKSSLHKKNKEGNKMTSSD